MPDVKGVTVGPTPQGKSTDVKQEGTAVVGAAEKNLSDVAKRLDISVESLLEANPGITNSTQLSAGQKLKLPGDGSSKSSSPPANDPPPKTSESDSKLRLAERNFAGTVMQADLNSKMPLPMFPGGRNLDPVEKVKLMQFMGEGPDKLGKQVADVAKYDPATAAKMLEALQNGSSLSDQGVIAAELAKNLNDQDLKKLTDKQEGRRFLDQVEGGINDGNVEAAHMVQIDRIRNARLSGPMTPQERPGLLLRYAMGPGAFKDQWLGNELAKDIRKDPAAGMRTANAVLAKALPGDRPAIAARIAENLDHQKLKDLAKTPDGKNFLQQMGKELVSPPPVKHPQTNRMESAQVAADLESNPAFGRLSEPTRKNISSVLERTQYSSNISREIASLATTPGFEKLSEATRNELVEAMAKKGIDPDYAAMLRSLAGDTEFQGLSDTARASVVDNLNKFTETSNYKDMSVVDQRRSLNIIGNMALHSASNPSNVEAKNTLKHFATGSVALKLYEDTRSTTAGYMQDGTLHLNVGHSQMSSPSNRLDQLGRGLLIDTSAHELNHLLNGETNGGTRERFLDEYRAFYTGTLAKGENPPTVNTLRARIKHLAANAPNGSAYDHLREVYKKDANFKRVVDKMLTDLNATPPKITTPEDLRTALLALPGGNKSKYLNKIPNLDNHY